MRFQRLQHNLEPYLQEAIEIFEVANTKKSMATAKLLRNRIDYNDPRFNAYRIPRSQNEIILWFSLKLYEYEAKLFDEEKKSSDFEKIYQNQCFSFPLTMPRNLRYLISLVKLIKEDFVWTELPNYILIRKVKNGIVSYTASQIDAMFYFEDNFLLSDEQIKKYKAIDSKRMYVQLYEQALKYKRIERNNKLKIVLFELKSKKPTEKKFQRRFRYFCKYDNFIQVYKLLKNFTDDEYLTQARFTYFLQQILLDKTNTKNSLCEVAGNQKLLKRFYNFYRQQNNLQQYDVLGFIKNIFNNELYHIQFLMQKQKIIKQILHSFNPEYQFDFQNILMYCGKEESMYEQSLVVIPHYMNKIINEMNRQ